MDITRGIETALEIVFSSDMERVFVGDGAADDGTPPALDEVDTSRMMRFALVASRMLADAAQKHIDYLEARAERGVK